jgi:hypothetical protein
MAGRLPILSILSIKDEVWGKAVLLKEANAISIELKKKVTTLNVDSSMPISPTSMQIKPKKGTIPVCAVDQYNIFAIDV